MLYPKLSNIKRNNIILIASIAISIIVINILLIINVLVDKTNHWSMLCIAGIVYVYGTVIYTKKRNINIASNVFVQCLLVSLLILAIDYFIGYSGWSINIAIPIVIMVANSTLMVLTIVSRKRYMRYALYHMLTFLFSMIQLILLFCGVNCCKWNSRTFIIANSNFMWQGNVGRNKEKITHVNRKLEDSGFRDGVYIPKREKRNVLKSRRTLTMQKS